MENSEYYTPDNIRPEILAYGSVLSQLGVGKAGKIGALVLRLEHDPDRQKTVAKEQYSKVPLYTQRVLYLEESLPSMAYMYIISPSGGILQGDRYRMDITLKNDAFFHLTTQGATRLYRMDKNYATQIVNITVGEGCYFEYIPDQIIPYRNSRFYQEVTLNTHDNSTMVYSEMLVPGRVGSGESFEYDICYLKTNSKNQNGELRFIDIAMLEPKKKSIRNFGVLEGFDVVGTVYILTETKYIRELNDQINSMIESLPKIYGGATILPKNSGVMIRLLGAFATDVRNVIYEVVRICRKVILNVSFSAIRKG
ncbi:MAG: urease accessory protein UreD [Nitrososphaeraceae archaeon]|nr:urease accessory protein UreD [Nitrososphaeraceae archaeon]MDW0331928.1 urease accessory protein UreD [Nitrososphaeraceae archaeon]